MWPKEAVERGKRFLAEGGDKRSLSEQEKQNLGFSIYIEYLSDPRDIDKLERILRDEWEKK